MSTDRRERRERSAEVPTEPHAGRQVRGMVTATWQREAKALIRLEDGGVVEAVGAERLEDTFELGAPAIVFYDGADVMTGWMLADRRIGVIIRRGRST